LVNSSTNDEAQLRPPWRSRAALLAEICLALAAFLAPWWLKWPEAAPPFSAAYPLGFVLSAVLLLALLAWSLSGLVGLRDALRRPAVLLMITALIAFAIWAIASQGWAFVRVRQPAVAQGNSLHIALWVASSLCALSLASARLRRWVLGGLLLGLLVYGLVGAGQVTAQRDLGLQALGEFRLDPQKSGVSVVESGPVRWLRPYGLTPHPNLFGGGILASLCAALALALDERPSRRRLGWAIWGLGLYLLLLSFSRGAWLALGLSALALLPILLHHTAWRRRWLPLLIPSLGLATLFLALYQPFVLARVGTRQENTEMRSIADRLVYSEIARHAIEARPLQGIGAGNFPWYAADYLWRNTDYDLRGDNVHNVALLVTAELGLVGAALLSAALLGAVLAACRLCWQKPEATRLALLALTLAYGVVGLFDHYPYTLTGYAWLWWASLALASRP